MDRRRTLFRLGWRGFNPKTVIHLFCREVQADQAPENYEAHTIDVVQPRRRQVPLKQPSRRSRQCDDQAKQRQSAAHIHQRSAESVFALVQHESDHAKRKSHRQPVHGCIEQHMADNGIHRLLYGNYRLMQIETLIHIVSGYRKGFAAKFYLVLAAPDCF